MFKQVFSYILFFILPVTLLSKEFSVKNYNVSDGLPTNLVKVVNVDENGFVWIGSDNGLILYDGNEFRSFTKELPSRYIKDVFISSDNRILVVTDLGIVEVNKNKQDVSFSTFIDGGLQRSDSTLLYPKSIYEDSENNLWINEPDAVLRWQDGKIKRYIFPVKYRADSYISSFSFFENKQNKLYTFSQRGYLFEYQEENDSFEKIFISGEGSFSIDAVLNLNDGRILIGGDKGLYILHLSSDHNTLRWERIGNYSNIISIARSNNNDIICGTSFSGLFILHDIENNREQINLPEFNNFVINDIYKQDNSTFWASTDQGLTLFYIPPFTTVKRFNNNSIQTLTRSNENTFYATNGTNIFKFFPNDDEYKSKPIYTVTKSSISSIAAHNNKIAYGNRDGQVIIINKSKREFVYSFNEKRAVEYLYFDNNGNLWVCRDGHSGVIKISPDYKSTEYGTESGFVTEVNVVKQNNAGDIYVASIGNSSYLFKYNREADNFENISISPDTQTDFIVSDLDFESDNTLFLASNNGIYHFNTLQNNFIKLPFLKEHNIKSLVYAPDSSLWLGTEKGIYRLKNNQLVSYDKDEGLPSLTTTYHSAYTEDNGNLWIGTFKGIARFTKDPFEIKKTKRPILLSLKTENRDQKIDFSEIKDFPINSLLTTEFTCLTYPAEEIRWNYKIEGTDTSWIELKERKITYKAVNSGSYILKIRAQQTGQLWSDPLEYKFKITPPWYYSWWGITLISFAIVSLILLLFTVRKALNEKRVAEKAMLEIEKNMVNVLSNIQVGIALINTTTNEIEDLNHKAEEMINLPKNEIVNRSYEVFFKDIPKSELDSELNQKNQKEKLLTTGSGVKLSIISLPVPVTIKEKSYVLETFLDISERKEFEEKLNEARIKAEDYADKMKRIREDVELKNYQLEIANTKAEEANKTKSLFLANVSHELRTPMNGVIGMSDLLYSTPLTPTQNKYVEIIKSSGEHLLRLINDLLDFSKIESGNLVIEGNRFSLTELLEDVNKSFRYSAESKGLHFKITADENLPDNFIGDSFRLKQILINLIGNAIKFTSDGSVTVSVNLDEYMDKFYRLKFSVTDTGMGIKQEHLDKLFIPFNQADNSITRKFAGTGLGLSISRQLVELMGGNIYAESKQNLGSNFYFILPLEKVNLNDNREEQENKDFGKPVKHLEKVGKISEDENTRKKTKADFMILLVEDDETNKIVAKTMLDNLGYKVSVASDGKSALELASYRDFDLIFMDCQMPEMDGFEATRRMRESKNEHQRNVPIIALTANAMQGDRERCISAGMNDYLSKPIILSKLKEKVESWLETDDTVSLENNILIKESEKGVTLKKPQVLNFKILFDELGPDTEIIETILATYIETFPQKIAELEKAIEENNHNTIKAVVHTIKGSSYNVYAEEIATIMEQIEARYQSQTAENLGSYLPQINEAFARLKDTFNDMIF